jgi:hypothetical protein
MDRLAFIKILFWKPWTVIIGIFIGVLGVYDLFLSQLISEALRPRFPRLADLIEKIGIQWYWWIIFFLLFSLVIVFESAYRYLNKYNEPKLINQLGELRAEGVVLRNSGSSLMSKDSIDKWRSGQLEWEGKVLGVLKNLSTYDCQNFNYLDTFTANRLFPEAISNEHRKYLQVFDEKLKRLEKIIEKYSGLRRNQ